ncbi:MarR family transcriptional regulator [Hoyosella rhizosphaerae]|uniref:HTH marR-type domain-containing protein n=1 Tax=Hoyosella rhizosphaerae TaxID=1755582 RepID=A0A916X8I9_9ACTN|nr:MarR family transcriptional regulator [Hoyosella rhizosphaerae]MBN4927050.1 MarR family transcriptional regulator [Hoyosella rhizosphaerae]GGC54443.1 hypothetical protein GCM10011410_03510 [Hoyosella rhizosphaerae]
MNTPPEFDEARTLGFKLFHVSERMSQEFDAIAASMNLTPTNARTLLELREPSPMRVVAQALVCDASNITGLADRLEKQGLLERVTGQDRRVKLLQLTDEGEKVREELASRIAKDSPVTARLTQSERATLEGLLDKLLL